MGHYIPHKQGMRRYTTQKGTMGIFYATHETNNRTLNTTKQRKLVYNKFDFDEIHRNAQEI